jgi:hypothetical protein
MFLSQFADLDSNFDQERISTHTQKNVHIPILSFICIINAYRMTSTKISAFSECLLLLW